MLPSGSLSSDATLSRHDIIVILTFSLTVWGYLRYKIVLLEMLESTIASVEPPVGVIGAVNWLKYSCCNLATFQSTKMAISHHLQVTLSRFKALFDYLLIDGVDQSIVRVFLVSFVCRKLVKIRWVMLALFAVSWTTITHPKIVALSQVLALIVTF